MSQSSEPNQPNPSASSNPSGKTFEAALEAGLDAVKKKNYSEAIAQLETVYQQASRRSTRLRAQMGLVKAYEGNKEYQQAFVRCKDLLKSSSEPTRRWAEEAMGVLKQRYTQLPKSLNQLTQSSPSRPQRLQPSIPSIDAVLFDEEASDEEALPNEKKRSLFSTEASTLVDPLAIEKSTLVDSSEASTLLDPLSVDTSASPTDDSDNGVTDGDRGPDLDEINDWFGEGVDEAEGLQEDLAGDSDRFNDLPQSTGFVPLDDRPAPASSFDSAASGSVDAEVVSDLPISDVSPDADLTGFVPLPPSPESSSTSSVSRLTHPSHEMSSSDPATSTPPSTTGEHGLEDNPFAFDLDGLGDTSNGIPSADHVSFDDTASQTPADFPVAGFPVASDLPPTTPLPPDFFPSAGNGRGDTSKPHPETSQDSVDSKPTVTRNQAVDPELAAALNVAMPRRRKRKVSQHPLPTPAAERARNWKPLKPIRQAEFWLSYLWTAIALVILLTGLTRVALETATPVWRSLQRFTTPPRWFYLENHTMLTIIILLIIGLVVSQWVLNVILGQCYGVKPLPERELDRRSPETLRLLKRTCQKHKFPIPRLKLVSSQVPFAMSYGLLPRTSHIVVSQGALTQLNDAEIAALYAGELGHIQHRRTLLLMLVTVMTQVPFLLYRWSAAWGDRYHNRLLRGVATGLSSIAYGLFWLGRWPALWLSRTRQVQGDRDAVNLTGNPNGRVSALAAMTGGIAQAIERNRSTDFILASFDLLMPVSPLQALTIGSVWIHPPSNGTADKTDAMHGTTAESVSEPDSTARLSSLLTWDSNNPHRQWLLINNTHPLLGDRIQMLNHDAEQLRLRPSIRLLSGSPRQSSLVKKTPSFWLQISPYLGLVIGFTLAIALWIVGGIADAVDVDQLEWLWKDMSLLYGCMAMGLSFGILMRINRFFPDISPSQTQSESALASLTRDPHATPLSSVPVTFEGRLLGRSGLSNGIGQDLMLKTSEGTIKLHWISPVGPLGNLMIGRVRPASLIGRSVSVTGWFRRGATVWIDVEKIRADGRTLVHSSHPLWSTLVAIAATLWGAYIIYRGTF
ncbi:MAG: M48 family metalloprotease [Cyanobacteria bacterium J06627_8]